MLIFSIIITAICVALSIGYLRFQRSSLNINKAALNSCQAYYLAYGGSEIVSCKNDHAQISYPHYNYSAFIREGGSKFGQISILAQFGPYPIRPLIGARSLGMAGISSIPVIWEP